MWTVETHSYEILEFAADGTLLSRFERDPSWFGKPTRGRPKGGLRSTVTALWADPSERLWVYSSRPTGEAGAAWRSPEARRAGGTIAEPLSTLYETVVEVLDPKGRVVLATGSILGSMVGVASDGRTLFHLHQSASVSRISVERFRLDADEDNAS